MEDRIQYLTDNQSLQKLDEGIYHNRIKGKYTNHSSILFQFLKKYKMYKLCFKVK